MSDDQTKDPNERQRAWLLAGALFAITIAAYLPAFGCHYIWDDDWYVTQNQTLRDVDGLRRIWFEIGAVPQYYPLVHTTFWVEFQLWELKPAGYHVVNVLLHATSAVLLWRLLAMLQVPGAWLAGAIFAVHPVCVESVAWITERKNTLSAVFYLSAALAFTRFANFEKSSPTKRRWWLYGLSVLLFVMAMLSKTTAITFPCAALLVVWWKRGTIRWREISWTLPMFLIAIPLGYLTVWMEKHHVGANTIDWELSPVDRVLIAGRALWFYASKILLPIQLTFTYPRWQIDSAAAWQYLFPIGFVVALGVLWSNRDKIGRGPLVAVLFFAGTLVPALGFFDVYPMRFSYVADHFQYLASIGIIALVAATVVRATVAATPAAVGSRITTQHLVIGSAIFGLGALTWFQCQIYQDEETLWNDTVSKNPGAWIAHNNLGGLRASQGDYPTAIGYFSEAIKLKPDLAEALFNRGRAKAAIGVLESAATDMQAAIDLSPSVTRRVLRRASVLIAIGGSAALDEAQAAAQAVLEKDPKQVDARAILARVHLMRGDVDAARGMLREAERLDPANLEMILTRSLVKVGDQDLDGAQSDLVRGLKSQPDRKLEFVRLVEKLENDPT